MALKHAASTKVKGEILTADEWNAAHIVAGFDSTGVITLSGDGLVYIEMRPDVDWATVQAQGKPTFVKQGVFGGYSLPLYAANEELFMIVCVPGRYDEASDPIAHVDCWLAGAEDNKNFKLQLSWEHYTPGTDIVPTTVNNVEVETATGVSAAQYQSYRVPFTIDYDVDTPNNLVADDILGLRLRRIAASANECAGEIVVPHTGISFRRDKLGVATP